MSIIAVLGDSVAHALEEHGQGEAMPFLKVVAGHREISSSAKIRKHCQLVHEVAMLRPACGDEINRVEDEFAG